MRSHKSGKKTNNNIQKRTRLWLRQTEHIYCHLWHSSWI